MKLAVMIPIKEVSQRVPQKSFKHLRDKPLAHWVLDSLNKSEFRDDMDIWINTDSTTVVDMVKSGDYDVQYYLRPVHVRGHDISMNKVINEWINSVAGHYDFYLQTHITNPFVKTEYFDEAIKAGDYYRQTTHRSVMAVTAHQCRMWHEGQPVNFNLGQVIPTQDLRPVLEDNSNFYVFDKTCFKEHGRVSPTPYTIRIPFPYNIDIDTEDEWLLAEVVADWILP